MVEDVWAPTARTLSVFLRMLIGCLRVLYVAEFGSCFWKEILLPLGFAVRTLR